MGTAVLHVWRSVEKCGMRVAVPTLSTRGQVRNRWAREELKDPVVRTHELEMWDLQKHVAVRRSVKNWM